MAALVAVARTNTSKFRWLLPTRGLSSTTQRTESRFIGYVSQYDRYQGYGFISPESLLPGGQGLRDVFVHRNDVEWPASTTGVSRTLEAGTRVSFRVVDDPGRPRQFRAVSVRPVHSSDQPASNQHSIELKRYQSRHRSPVLDFSGLKKAIAEHGKRVSE